MQNQFFGRKAACAVLDSRGHPAAEDTTNGFSDAVIKQIREYIHGQKSENKKPAIDEPPELEPIQSSDIDEKTDPLPATGNESGSIGVVGSIVEQIDSKPKNAADKKLDANKTEFEKADTAPDKGKRKKKRRHRKIPLRYRSSVLERLRRYQTKLAEERRKKE